MNNVQTLAKIEKRLRQLERRIGNPIQERQDFERARRETIEYIHKAQEYLGRPTAEIELSRKEDLSSVAFRWWLDCMRRYGNERGDPESPTGYPPPPELPPFMKFSAKS